LTRKLKLPIIGFISWSRFPNIGTRVGGCGRKLTEPKEIWLSSTIELLCDANENIIKSMNLTPKVPTVNANWWGWISTMS
jgi:hypothetical protein